MITYSPEMIEVCKQRVRAYRALIRKPSKKTWLAQPRSEHCPFCVQAARDQAHMGTCCNCPLFGFECYSGLNGKQIVSLHTKPSTIRRKATARLRWLLTSFHKAGILKRCKLPAKP